MSRKHGTCQDCGEPVVFVLVLPAVPRRGTRRSYIPLNVRFDPKGPIPPSHALSAGRTTCHVITEDHPLEDHEHPALTHFATCPRRARTDRPSTAAEGVPA